jgi:peptidoglycan/LPS O-acetylase OafA/YrhL
MNREISLYLDFLRFSSAMVVFLGHASGKLTNAFLWQLNSYLAAAVMVFFVLSGYVIAYVHDVKEHSFTNYSIARISRFSSVAVPALILTVVFDSWGTQINYDLYYGGPWPNPAPYVMNYILSFFYIQNVWGLNLNPGINVPFWSLSFEFGFYFLFAFFVFFSGIKRVVFLALTCALIGPNIITYLPIWLVGVLVYKLHKCIKSLHLSISSILFFASAGAFIVLVPIIKTNFHYTPFYYIGGRNVLADYLYATIFGIHLFSAAYMCNFLRLLLPFKKVIITLSSCTFSLYLFHRPLIQFFAAIEVGPPESWVSRLTVLGGTLLIVFTVGYWSEQQRYRLKSLLTALLNKRRITETA